MALMVCIGAPPTIVFAQQGTPSRNTLSIPTQQHPNEMPSLKAPIPQPETSLEVPSLRLRRQPGFEQVTVTVTDSSGKYVTDLKEDDFRVFEDGEQRSIAFFRVDLSAPVSLGLVVDCSFSMATKLPQARTAITRMVDDLDPRDDVFLESFSDEATLVQPFTFDHREIVDHLRFLHPLSHTSLYDAVYMGLYELALGQRDKRALVIVTDGMDNMSKTKRDGVISAARAMKVLIYAIGIGEQAVDSEQGIWKLIRRFGDDDVDMHTLTQLSDETGARAFNLHRVGDGDQLNRDCAEISNELRQQYSVAYLSPDPGRPGYRTLHVDVPTHPELSVRVRKSVAVIPSVTPPVIPH